MTDNFSHVEWTNTYKGRKNPFFSRVADFPDLYGEPPQECYHSVYRFGTDVAEHAERTGSIAEFNGPCRAVGLHFDFDGPSAFSNVNCFTEKMCMTEKYECSIDDMRFYFSGNRGYHVWIYSEETRSIPPGENVPDFIKNVCTKLAGEYRSFDSSVYDRTRLFRAINSRHPKSGLFKIPLFAAEFWVSNETEIREMAKCQRRLDDSATIKKYLKGHTNYGNA